MQQMSDGVAGQIEYVISSWFAARQRFRDLPKIEVTAIVSKMWTGVVQKCKDEIPKPEDSKNVVADERDLQLLNSVNEIVTHKIETKFN